MSYLRKSLVFYFFSITLLLSMMSCWHSKNNLANDVISLRVFIDENFAGAESSDFDSLINNFEKREKVKIEWISYKNNPRFVLENIQKDPNFAIDMLYGIDNMNLLDFVDSQLFEPYISSENDSIVTEINFDVTHSFTPLNFSFLGFEFSQENWKKEIPQNFNDLTREPWKNNYILMNPRTSGTGMLYLLWMEAKGEDVERLFKSLKSNAFAIVPDWSTGYMLYNAKESPFVPTYTTSPAYHIFHDNDHSQKIALADETSYPTTQYIGILKKSPHLELCKKFLDYLLSSQVQSAITRKVWGYPARRDAKLPDEFKELTLPKKILSHSPEQIRELTRKWLSSDWL